MSLRISSESLQQHWLRGVANAGMVERLWQPRSVQAAMSGKWESKARGQGMSFDSVRHYVAGDEVRHMDWRVTARTGKPHVKQFLEDKQRPIWIVVDDSSSMQFGTRRTFKCVLAAELAMMLGGAAHAAGEKPAFVVYRSGGEDIEYRAISQPRSKQAAQQTGQLFMHPAAEPMAHSMRAAGTHPSALWQALRQLPAIRRGGGGHVFWISDFAQEMGSHRAELRTRLSWIRQRYGVTCIAVDDQADWELPSDGWLNLSTGAGQAVRVPASEAEFKKQHHAWWAKRRNAWNGLAAQLGMLWVDGRTQQHAWQVLGR